LSREEKAEKKPEQSVETLFLSKFFGVQALALKTGPRLTHFSLIQPWQEYPIGTIYLAKVLDVDLGLEAVFLDLGDGKEGFLRARDLIKQDTSGEKPKTGDAVLQTIKQGQTLLVQVQKLAAPGKRLPCTMYVEFAGFYSVFLPFGSDIRFSRRFRGSKKEWRHFGREQIGGQGGLLLRSASLSVPRFQIIEELKGLTMRWETIQESLRVSGKTRILDAIDANPMKRFFSSQLSNLPSKIYVDDVLWYEELRQWGQSGGPNISSSLSLHTGDSSLFATYGLTGPIQNLFQPKVWLNCGGYLVFNRTEALTVIDVNSGKARPSPSQKTKVNLQAAKEIAHQILLRDIGGIIVIDFINMKLMEDRKRIEAAFTSELGSSVSQCKIEPINALGILSLSRRRREQSYWSLAGSPCSSCNGTGYETNLELQAFNLLQEMKSYENGTMSVIAGHQLYQWLCPKWSKMTWRDPARLVRDRKGELKPHGFRIVPEDEQP